MPQPPSKPSKRKPTLADQKREIQEHLKLMSLDDSRNLLDRIGRLEAFVSALKAHLRSLVEKLPEEFPNWDMKEVRGPRSVADVIGMVHAIREDLSEDQILEATKLSVKKLEDAWVKWRREQQQLHLKEAKQQFDDKFASYLKQGTIKKLVRKKGTARV